MFGYFINLYKMVANWKFLIFNLVKILPTDFLISEMGEEKRDSLTTLKCESIQKAWPQFFLLWLNMFHKWQIYCG